MQHCTAISATAELLFYAHGVYLVLVSSSTVQILILCNFRCKVELHASFCLCVGMGFNMVTLTSFVIVQQHFKKFRAVAAGIAASGLSLGTLSAGPLLTAMLNAFQWRGTLLLMSAMVLNCCVFGALYRPPPTQKHRKRQNCSSSAGVQGSDITLCETLRQLLRDLTDLSLFSNIPFTLVLSLIHI